MAYARCPISTLQTMRTRQKNITCVTCTPHGQHQGLSRSSSLSSHTGEVFSHQYCAHETHHSVSFQYGNAQLRAVMRLWTTWKGRPALGWNTNPLPPCTALACARTAYDKTPNAFACMQPAKSLRKIDKDEHRTSQKKMH